VARERKTLLVRTLTVWRLDAALEVKRECKKNVGISGRRKTKKIKKIYKMSSVSDTDFVELIPSQEAVSCTYT
jgi:hypothetical protein